MYIIPYIRIFNCVSRYEVIINDYFSTHTHTHTHANGTGKLTPLQSPSNLPLFLRSEVIYPTRLIFLFISINKSVLNGYPMNVTFEIKLLNILR